ncbi:MAG: hypothetical protein GEV03_23485 [Streptosporangiales bacterium]|nr:hypothetical protein [Streptosporangiales bacterium]
MEPRNGRRPRDEAVSAKEPRRPSNFDELRFKPQKPVQWFSPGVLGASALRVAINATFGEYLDKRELQGSIDAGPLLHHADKDEIWIDYISDTGDGFASTYSVAWLAARERLVVEGSELPRADVVVLGGDEVYPIGGAEAYENRFIGPYEASLPWLPADNPEMYFVAGNHDWYDGLTAFTRSFCQGGWIGARRTRQTRSYFALQLPHRWWLWGLDIQFNSYIDEPQLRYFEHVVGLMREGDRVILCTAVPSWTHAADEKAFYKLGYVEHHLIGGAKAELTLTLSGDSHHYAHYLGDSGGTHKITAGGGGAFLHGTNDLHEHVELHPDKDPQVGSQRFDLGPCYPDRGTSRSLALGAVTLPLKNPSFVAVPAAMYLLLGWSVEFGLRAFPGRLSRLDQSGAAFGWLDGLVGLGRNPVSVLLVLALLGATYGFAKPPDRWMRRKVPAKAAMGVAHTVLHLLVFVTSMWLAVHACRALGLQGAGFTAASLATLTVLGAVLGSLVMGAYLAFCCAVLNAHGNEAFSAMGRMGYKNFLRLHIDAQGVLHVYPLGLRRATKNWRPDPDNTAEASWLAPASEAETPKTHFIEAPFTIEGRKQ